MPEYGLGSEYSDSWDLNFNSINTTVMSFTVNPNLAYKVTDKWSVGAGMRFLYFDFEQYSLPVVTPYGHRFKNRLKGDNDMKDYGYQVGTKYDLFENFAVGLVYKSMTRVHVKGTSRNHLYSAADPTTAAALIPANPVPRPAPIPAKKQIKNSYSIQYSSFHSCFSSIFS